MFPRLPPPWRSHFHSWDRRAHAHCRLNRCLPLWKLLGLWYQDRGLSGLFFHRVGGPSGAETACAGIWRLCRIGLLFLSGLENDLLRGIHGGKIVFVLFERFLQLRLVSSFALFLCTQSVVLQNQCLIDLTLFLGSLSHLIR